MTFPKIELHVHLEGTVRAATLLQIARRNDVPLPADSMEGLAEQTRDRLRQVGESFDWAGLAAAGQA